MKGELCEAVRFVCERETGGVLQPKELLEDRTGVINETAALVLEVKNTHKNITSCATLETYKETPIFIPTYITEDAVDLVARKLLGGSGLGGT